MKKLLLGFIVYSQPPHGTIKAVGSDLLYRSVRTDIDYNCTVSMLCPRVVRDPHLYQSSSTALEVG